MKKILIVDDEKDIVETIQFVLESQGYTCITAFDGESGLKKAKDKNPDLKFDKKYKDIPIIMLTARSQKEDKMIGEETGADLYMTKPFDIEELINNVKKLCPIKEG